MTVTALTIAGSDPSGGAGLQADLKTFHQHGVYGMAVVAVLTAQSTQGVTRVESVEASMLQAQLDVLLADITPGAAKTGALGSAQNVECVAAIARRAAFPLVVDPVMISKHGHALMGEPARAALLHALVPVAALLTPNAPEAEALTGRRVTSLAEARDAARALADLGAKAVLVKGGHLGGTRAIDVLLVNGAFTEFDAPRIDTRHTHGTGCTYSAAITAQLARGLQLELAVEHAKRWLTEAIRTAPRVGHGIGPLNHFAPLAGS